MNTRKIGAEGETLACAYLELQGMSVIQTNYHAGLRGEIDVIARDGETYVFAEIKLRKGRVYGYGRESVTPKKQEAIIYAAKHYFMRKRLDGVPARYDVIEITVNDSSVEIQHIKNAFEGTAW